MSEICKEHIDNPARIYHQCIGCEIEWYEQKKKELETEIEHLKTLLNDYGRELSNSYLMISQYKEVDKVIEWIKEKFEEEWTYELGTGEVVDEIIQKLEEAVGGESNDPQTTS